MRRKSSRKKPQGGAIERVFNQKRRGCVAPFLGAAGLSLSLASGASAVTGGQAMQSVGTAHEVTLGE
jgi:hypothetical protein